MTFFAQQPLEQPIMKTKQPKWSGSFLRCIEAILKPWIRSGFGNYFDHQNWPFSALTPTNTCFKSQIGNESKMLFHVFVGVSLIGVIVSSDNLECFRKNTKLIPVTGEQNVIGIK